MRLSPADRCGGFTSKRLALLAPVEHKLVQPARWLQTQTQTQTPDENNEHREEKNDNILASEEEN